MVGFWCNIDRYSTNAALLLQTFPSAAKEIRGFTIALLRTNHILLPLKEAIADKIPASQEASSWVRYTGYYGYHKIPALLLSLYLTVQGISLGSRSLQGRSVLLETSQESLTVLFCCYFVTVTMTIKEPQFLQIVFRFRGMEFYSVHRDYSHS